MDNSKKFMQVGVGCSCAYAFFFMAYALFHATEIRCLSPNEFGDFLAGFAGPLALAWLVLGYFQQGEELRLQALELHSSVEAQSAMAATAKLQLEADNKKWEAELESIRQEQMRQRLANMPRFVLRTSNSSHSGDNHSYGFVLTNIGQSAYDFNMTDLHAASPPIAPRTTPILDRMAQIEFSVSYVGSVPMPTYMLAISCTNVQGDAFLQNIRVTFVQESAANPYVLIEPEKINPPSFH